MRTVVSFIVFFMICFVSSAQSLDYDAISREFIADTARVEQAYSDAIEKDFSTVGMLQSMSKYEEDYDGLLNKYYKLLLNSLDEADKEILSSSQRNWIKLRDSEKELIGVLHAKVYKEAGGGTMWSLLAAETRANITRNRVFEIYSYLLFGDIGVE